MRILLKDKVSQMSYEINQPTNILTKEEKKMLLSLLILCSKATITHK